MRLITASSLICLTACSTTTFDAGDVSMCLSNDTTSGIHQTAASSWDITGMVTDVQSLDGTEIPGLDCSAEASVAVNITETNGTTWTVAFGITDPHGEDATPELDLNMNDTVNLFFQQEAGVITNRGMMIVDGDGLVAALDEGIDGGALENQNVLGFDVLRGVEVGADKDECGRRSGTQITFEGTESLTPKPFDHGSMEVEGVDYQIQAISSYYWSKSRCEELTDQLAWSVFRYLS